jgi:hypothetical protein
MTVEQERKRTMLPLDKASAHTRSEIAWALREWNTALAEAHNSPEAERYADAIALIVPFLDDRQALADRRAAYYSPTAELT